ncbi:MAG: hypothetical protein IT320_04845 [Anaerolineae bacterium]|nr:hypothetical protein [Anaerolineae bacterium]
MSFDSPELMSTRAHAPANRARTPANRMGQIIEYALLAEAPAAAAATDQNRILVARLIERIEGNDRIDEATAPKPAN